MQGRIKKAGGIQETGEEESGGELTRICLGVGGGWEEIHERGLDGNKLRVTDRKDKRG